MSTATTTAPQATAPTPPLASNPPAAQPARPYTTLAFPFGMNRTKPCKVSAGNVVGDYLTDDEERMEVYVQHLEAENASLRARVATLENDVERMEPAYLRAKLSDAGGETDAGNQAAKGRKGGGR